MHDDRGKIPTTVFTGFLGAGKTSLIRNLLAPERRPADRADHQRVRRDRRRSRAAAGLRRCDLRRGRHRRAGERLHLLHRRRRLRADHAAAAGARAAARAHRDRDLGPGPAQAADQGVQLARDRARGSRSTAWSRWSMPPPCATACSRADPDALAAQRRPTRRSITTARSRSCSRSSSPPPIWWWSTRPTCWRTATGRAVEARVRQELRAGVGMVRARHAAVPTDGAGRPRRGGRRAISIRAPRTTTTASDHEHDDFTSFHVEPAGARRPAGVRRPAAARDRGPPDPAGQGLPAVAGKPMRLVLQGVGDRVQHYFDRAWRSGRGARRPARGDRRARPRPGRDRRRRCAADRAQPSCICSTRGPPRRTTPARRSTSARPRATSSSCRRPIPSSPASPRRRPARPADAPSLRLANLLQLGHPLSVDLYVEQVVAQGAPGGPAPARRRAATGLTAWSRSPAPAAPGASRSRCCRATTARSRACAAGARCPPRPATGCGSTACTAASTTPASFWPTPRACSAATSPGASRRRCCAPGSTGRAWCGPTSHDPRPLAAGPAGRGRGVLPRAGAGGRSRRDRRPDRRPCRRTGSIRCRSSPPACKEPRRRRWCASCSSRRRRTVVLNATGFAVSSLGERRGHAARLVADRAVLQLVLAGGSDVGLAGRHARPVAARSGDERRPARGRRPDNYPRGRVQEPRKRFDARTETNIVGFAPVADRDRFRRRAGGRLGAARAHAGCRAAGRDRARQLPQPRRPHRQWRRPRYAGQHRAVCCRRMRARRLSRSRACPRTAQA